MKRQPSPAGLLAESCTLLRPVLLPAGFRLEIMDGPSEAFATADRFRGLRGAPRTRDR